MDPAAFVPSEELQEELTDSVSRWISLWLGHEQKEFRHALETGATESGFRRAQLQFVSCVPEVCVPADSVTVSTRGSKEPIQPPAFAGGSASAFHHCWGSEELLQPSIFAGGSEEYSHHSHLQLPPERPRSRSMTDHQSKFTKD